MAYRRDAPPSETVPLPIETVYNSSNDSLSCIINGNECYFTNGSNHFNRIYFKYPPEWLTSDVGEKIIGVRNMKITVKTSMQLNFTLYIRKYRKDKFDNMASMIYPHDNPSNLDDEQIQDVVDRLDRDDCRVFKIDYCHDIFDKLDDFIADLIDTIKDESIYDKLYDAIITATNDDNEDEAEFKARQIESIEQLNKDKDDYYLMCLRNDISFYLDVDSDINIIKDIVDTTLLVFAGKNPEYYIDFMMTAINDDVTYKKLYEWGDLEDEPLYISKLQQDELDFTYHDDGTPNDRFDFDTACYFDLDDDDRVDLHDIIKFHRELSFKNVMLTPQCEVAASFASQSNHNLIGRTNEMYTPIKYYKLNDNDDKFWIEFYDRNEITVPVSFNDHLVFTIDMVFLQNRKLIYT